MRWVLFGALFIAALSSADSARAQMQAPFCMVSNSGHASCFYYSLDACRQAAASMGGMCSANFQQPQPQRVYQRAQPVQIQQPNIYESFQRGQEAGMRKRQAREEHQARMALLEAQTRAVQSAQATPSPAYVPSPPSSNVGPGPAILYRCPAANGQPITYTSKPATGCVVVGSYP